MEAWFSSGADGSSPPSEALPSGLILLHAVSDAVIVLAFFAIPIALLYIHSKRGDSNRGETILVRLFALFIVAVGLAHLASLLTILMPGISSKGLEGLLKALGALLALIAAVVIWRLAP